MEITHHFFSLLHDDAFGLEIVVDHYLPDGCAVPCGTLLRESCRVGRASRALVPLQCKIREQGSVFPGASGAGGCQQLWAGG